MIYLWHSDTGWEEHEITDTEALKERGIQIGTGAWVGEEAGR